MTTTAAVIGTGFIGTVHIEAIRRMGVPVKGALAGSAESTKSASNRLNLAHSYKDVSEIASDKDINIVHVTSPILYTNTNLYAFIIAKISCKRKVYLYFCF